MAEIETRDRNWKRDKGERRRETMLRRTRAWESEAGLKEIEGALGEEKSRMGKKIPPEGAECIEGAVAALIAARAKGAIAELWPATNYW